MAILTQPETSRHRMVAIGMWDGVHLGHRFLVDFVKQEAAKRGLCPAVVTFPDHPLALIAPDRCPALISSFEDRMRRLTDAGASDIIILPFDERLRMLTIEEFMRRLKEDYAVDAIAVGFNNRFGHGPNHDIDTYTSIGRSLGIEVIPAPEFTLDGRAISSSAIRRMLSQGLVDEAAKALGRNYTISGPVVHGHSIGRTLGFPTANVAPDSIHTILPGRGVYAANISIDSGTPRRAMVNIGTRPTIDPTSFATSIEVHIPDFEEDIYNCTLSISFLKRLRDEMRFDSVDALRKQLFLDKKALFDLYD